MRSSLKQPKARRPFGDELISACQQPGDRKTDGKRDQYSTASAHMAHTSGAPGAFANRAVSGQAILKKG